MVPQGGDVADVGEAGDIMDPGCNTEIGKETDKSDDAVAASGPAATLEDQGCGRTCQRPGVVLNPILRCRRWKTRWGDAGGASAARGGALCGKSDER